MEEKWMVNDVLINYIYLINEYTNLISITKDNKIREKLIEIRNEIEEFQIQFLKLLKLKLYYFD